MEYKEIVAVTGEPGLFQLVSSKGDGAIVRTLNGETTKFVPSRKHNFTPLESIEVFTDGPNVPLSDVFRAMQEQEESLPVPPAAGEADDIRRYFTEVFPSLDEERVYMSDMKKMLKWYPQLKAHDLLQFPEEEAAEENPENTTGGVEAEAGDEATETESKTAEAAPAEEEKAAPETGKKTSEQKDPEQKSADKNAAAKKARGAAKNNEKPEKKATPKKTKAE